ncbi:MAG: 30S ribosome-binding factor RbfA, partial [Candidatus Omnitrophica bacterium]|nr:30S ribosome-binding factor RbfA [Candidatus Omnitrophota bacterium]
RVAQMLKEEIGNIIHDELKDPRLGFITVTGVELTDDLRYAKVYFSILGSHQEEANTKEALDSSLGFIRRQIARRLTLRFVPEIIFKQDRAAEYSIQIQKVLDEIKGLTKSDEHRKNSRVRKKK